MRGSNLGRFSLPIHVNSSFCFLLTTMSSIEPLPRKRPSDGKQLLERSLLPQLPLDLGNQLLAPTVNLVLRVEQRRRFSFRCASRALICF